MSGTGVTTEERLVAGGWTRQFNTDEPRLSEAVERYDQMALEVRLEPVVLDPDSETCQMCCRVAAVRSLTRRACSPASEPVLSPGEGQPAPR